MYTVRQLQEYLQSSAASILIVEGDAVFSRRIQTSLEVEGYSVEVVSEGRQAIEKVAVSPFDLVIVELVLPDVSGFEVIRRIRESGSATLVLVLSAWDEEVAKVQSFRLGADDYVVKPVGLLELIARVGALLRRAVYGSPDDVVARRPAIEFGQVGIDRARRTVTRSGKLVELTPMEFDLLVYLVDANGRIVSREILMRRVWRYATNVASRTIDQHISRLRFKLEEDHLHPVHIITVRKVGYRIQRTSDPSDERVTDGDEPGALHCA